MTDRLPDNFAQIGKGTASSSDKDVLKPVTFKPDQAEIAEEAKKRILNDKEVKDQKGLTVVNGMIENPE